MAGQNPAMGIVSRGGYNPNYCSFEPVGPIQWTLGDCAILWQALACCAARDPGSADRPVPDYRAALSGDIRGLRIGAVRHFWEEDLPAKDETRRSMDAAIAVFRGLGAIVEDVRLDPMQVYTDVKVVIAESEDRKSTRLNSSH